MSKLNLEPVFQNPINANPLLQVNQGFQFARQKYLWKLMLNWWQGKVYVKTEGRKSSHKILIH